MNFLVISCQLSVVSFTKTYNFKLGTYNSLYSSMRDFIFVKIFNLKENDTDGIQIKSSG
jgi:hypothetical protein